MAVFQLDHSSDPTSDGSIIENVIPSLSNADIDVLLGFKRTGTVFSFKDLVSLLKLLYAQRHKSLIMSILDSCENFNVLDSFGNTILHNFLDSSGNDKDANERGIANIIEFFIARGIEINTPNKNGITVLHLAAKNKHVLTVELLIQNNANVTMLDNKGNSVLHFVSMMKVKIDANVEKTMIDLFIKKGCNINARNNLNMTPLLTATQSGCINAVRALIVYGAIIESAGGKDMSYPLHVAVKYNYTTIIKHLLRRGVNIYSKREDGKTALHVAAVCGGRVRTVVLLLERLMDPDTRDDDGRTALYWACRYGNLEMMRELLNWGADVNVKDKINITPIISSQRWGNAAWNELQRYVITLKAAGVDIECVNNNYEKKIYNRSLASCVQIEVSMMRKTKIYDSTTLNDVLKMKLNKLAVFKNNQAFKELITSTIFEGNFPFYSSIIKSFCARGIVRSNLLNEGTKVLREFSDVPMLPEYCTHEIFKYLSNEDLINLIRQAV